MVQNLEAFSSPESIRKSILEAEEPVVAPEVDANSRLTIPLNTAHRNVAASVAVIGTLQPKQRKEASVKLIDIAEAALQAVEKTLKRSGTADPSLLAQLRKINRQLAAFDEQFSTLAVNENRYYGDDEDPEEYAYQTDNDGTPTTFESGEIADPTITPTAVRVLANNADMVDPEMGEGDPAKDDVEPVEGEATDTTVDTEAAADAVIDALANAEDTEEQEDSKLPPTFTPKGTNESIHESPSENLKMLSLLVNAM